MRAQRNPPETGGIYGKKLRGDQRILPPGRTFVL
jgi:hypothetical protein